MTDLDLTLNDPPVREDGLCAVDGKERPELAVEKGDPFCSQLCCRVYYGVVFPSDANSRPNAKRRKREAGEEVTMTGRRKVAKV